MVMAQPFEWEQMQAAIRRLDTPPLQVQIEARILEVSLKNQLQYGVQWWLGNLMTGPNGGSYENPHSIYQYPNKYGRSGSTLGAAGPDAATSNFFYSFLNSKFQAQLSALESSGVAKTLSAPSLVVNNNQEASLSVGDQIPVVQTYYNGLGGLGGTTGINGSNGYYGGGLTGSVQYLSTGVSLNVMPRVNPGGLVYLDIQQEVSTISADVPTNNASGNPPIAQRQFQTSVAVQSGQTLLLGGLIKEEKSNGDSGVPLVNKVPILRDLFGVTKESTNRTELIVLITPRVINNSDEARQVTEDYVKQFESLTPLRAKQAASQPSQSTPAPQEPPQTYPAPEPMKSQEPSSEH